MDKDISPLQAGTEVPDFALRDQERTEFKLSDFRGKKVLVSFHPVAWTTLCNQQMQALEENKDVLDSLNTVAVAISVDSVPSKFSWAHSIGIKETRLLSDFWPHGKVASLFGVFREKDGIAQKSNFIIDENGKIVFSKLYETNDVPDIEEIISVLKGL
jgi:peroxiredoxin